jgi:hypothetical protein
MEARPYNATEDYPTISSWWRERDFPTIPEHHLPKTGVVVGDVAAGFLYATDGGIAIMEWVTTNPAASSEQRHLALGILVNELCEQARAQGFSMMFASVGDVGLISRYQEHGFFVSDKGATNMMKRV